MDDPRPSPRGPADLPRLDVLKSCTLRESAVSRRGAASSTYTPRPGRPLVVRSQFLIDKIQIRSPLPLSSGPGSPRRSAACASESRRCGALVFLRRLIAHQRRPVSLSIPVALPSPSRCWPWTRAARSARSSRPVHASPRSTVAPPTARRRRCDAPRRPARSACLARTEPRLDSLEQRNDAGHNALVAPGPGTASGRHLALGPALPHHDNASLPVRVSRSGQ